MWRRLCLSFDFASEQLQHWWLVVFLKLHLLALTQNFILIFFSFIQKVLGVPLFFSLHAKVTPIVPDARVINTYLLGNHCVADVVVRTHKEDLNKSVCIQIDGTTVRYCKPFIENNSFIFIYLVTTFHSLFRNHIVKW